MDQTRLECQARTLETQLHATHRPRPHSPPMPIDPRYGHAGWVEIGGFEYKILRQIKTNRYRREYRIIENS